MWEVLDVCELSVQVASPTCLAWSPDYKMAIATKKGVCVYELTPDSSSTSRHLTFRKLLIHNHKEVNPSLAKCSVLESSFSDLPLDLIHKIITDRIVSPHMMSGEISFRQTRLVKWSPMIQLGHAPRPISYLATLTIDHRLRLAQQIGRKFVHVADLSESLLRYLNTNSRLKLKDSKSSTPITKEKPSVAVCRKLMRAAYFMAFNTFAFAVVEEETIVMFTGQESGEIIMWNIVSSCKEEINEDDYQSLLGSHACCLEPKVMFVHDSDAGAVTELHVATIDDSKVVVFCGSREGIVSAFLLTSQNLVFLGHIWDEEDRMKVTRIEYLQETATEHNVIIAKSNYLVALRVDFNWEEMKIVVSKRISVSAGMPVVGIEVVSNGVLLATSQKGSLFTWNLEKNVKQDVDIKINRKDYWCYGLSSSPSKVFHALVETVSAMSDGPRLHSPTRVTLLTNQEISSVLAKLQSTNGAEMLPADCLEVYRLFLLRSNAAKNKAIMDDTNDYSLMEVDEPQGDGWRSSLWWEKSVLLTACKARKHPHTAQHEASLLAVETRARCLAALSQLETGGFENWPFSSSAAEFILKFSNLEEERKLADDTIGGPSVSGGSQTPPQRLQRRATRTQHREHTHPDDCGGSLSKEKKLGSWTCHLCNKKAKIEGVRMIKCVEGHIWSRCGWSQAACQSPDSLFTCGWCSLTFLHLPPSHKCPLCSGPVSLC